MENETNEIVQKTVNSLKAEADFLENSIHEIEEHLKEQDRRMDELYALMKQVFCL